MNHASYFEAIDIAQLRHEFPVGDAFLSRYQGMSEDELRAHQSQLLVRVLARAAKDTILSTPVGGCGCRLP